MEVIRRDNLKRHLLARRKQMHWKSIGVGDDREPMDCSKVVLTEAPWALKAFKTDYSVHQIYERSGECTPRFRNRRRATLNTSQDINDSSSRLTLRIQ